MGSINNNPFETIVYKVPEPCKSCYYQDMVSESNGFSCCGKVFEFHVSIHCKHQDVCKYLNDNNSAVLLDRIIGKEN